MSRVRRRVLGPNDELCRPRSCHLKGTCARYLSPVGQGSTLADHSDVCGYMTGCRYHLSEMVDDAAAATPRVIKSPVKGI